MAQQHFQVTNHGTLVGFLPLTDEGAGWWQENVAEGPTLGACHYVEARFAGDILDGLAQEGLV